MMKMMSMMRMMPMEQTIKNPQSGKVNSRTRPRLILLREFSGYDDMRYVIEQALEALILEKYDEMLLQKAG